MARWLLRAHLSWPSFWSSEFLCQVHVFRGLSYWLVATAVAHALDSFNSIISFFVTFLLQGSCQWFVCAMHENLWKAQAYTRSLLVMNIRSTRIKKGISHVLSWSSVDIGGPRKTYEYLNQHTTPITTLAASNSYRVSFSTPATPAVHSPSGFGALEMWWTTTPHRRGVYVPF
jgi:hypothetical protein